MLFSYRSSGSARSVVFRVCPENNLLTIYATSVFLAFYWLSSRHLKEIQTILATGDVNTLSAECEHVLRTYGFLFDGYEPEYWFWGVIVELLRKTALAVVVTGFESPSLQLLGAIMVLTLQISVVSIAKPYIHFEMDILEFVSSLVAWCFAVSGVYQYLSPDEPTMAVASLSLSIIWFCFFLFVSCWAMWRFYQYQKIRLLGATESETKAGGVLALLQSKSKRSVKAVFMAAMLSNAMIKKDVDGNAATAARDKDAALPPVDTHKEVHARNVALNGDFEAASSEPIISVAQSKPRGLQDGALPPIAITSTRRGERVLEKEAYATAPSVPQTAPPLPPLQPAFRQTQTYPNLASSARHKASPLSSLTFPAVLYD
jgi:hypothetical protein